MKLLSSILALGLITSLAHADLGWGWGLRVSLARGLACKSKPCTSSASAPDKPGGKKIALTFDDGPSAVFTPQVLDILKKHGVKATFFLLGKNVASNKALIRRALDEGHVVGSHSWDHPSFWTLTRDQVDHQILDTEKALNDVGVKPEFFRFPFGNSNQYALDLLKSRGYKVVGWNIDSCDWGFSKAGVLAADTNKNCSGMNVQVTEAHPYLLKQLTSRNGGIVLMHDVQKVTAENLDQLLTELENDSYEFVQINNAEVFPLLNQ
jgi:peptidoglycan/xylan/chitin deacetylase (PgdA/CDA1 family)